jgi:hypothetical protein
MKATKFHQVETIVAVIGPAGDAIQTHHIVAIFHNTNVKVAKPSIERVSLHDGVYCALNSKSGTKPMNSVIHDVPHQLNDNKNAEARHKTNFVFLENCLLNCIILKI